MKSIFKIFLVFGYAVASFLNVHSQPLNWQKLYSGLPNGRDLGFGVCQTTDGNFVIVGSTQISYMVMYILKINQLGDTLWTKKIDGTSPNQMLYTVVPTEDGGCVFTGDASSLFSIKLDHSGNVVWNKVYPGSEGQCFRLIETPDSGFIGCGRIGEGAFIIKIKKNGDFGYYKTFSGRFKSFNSIDNANNSGYIVCGSDYDTTAGNTLRANVLRLNETGDIIWEKNYYDTLGLRLTGKVIKRTNSGYILSGAGRISVEPFQTKYFMKLDTSGNTIYFKKFNTTGAQYLADVQIINQNRILFVSSIDSAATTNGLLTISDSLGNIIDEKTYQSPRSLDLQSGILTNKKEIIVTGIWNVSSFNSADVYCMKTDTTLFANSVVNINNNNSKILSEYILYQNYPNPFNPITNLEFQIPVSRGEPKSGIVTLKIYDLLGKEVAALVNESLNPGTYKYEFDGSNFPSGIYFYTLEAGDFRAVKRMVLLK